MNEFTKDELEFIHKWLDWITKEDYPLKNKIQSMIDNYCEHEWMTFLQDQNNEPFIEKCMECDYLRTSKSDY